MSTEKAILADIGRILDRADELERQAKTSPPKATISYAEFIRRRQEGAK